MTKDELDGALYVSERWLKLQQIDRLNLKMKFKLNQMMTLKKLQTVEEVHVAGEFVVEVSPQSIEDANIAAHIKKRETDIA